MRALKTHILKHEEDTGRRSLQYRRRFNTLKRELLQGGGGKIKLALPPGTYAACRQTKKSKRLIDPIPLSASQHAKMLAQLKKLPSQDGTYTREGYDGYTLHFTIKGRQITQIVQKKGYRSRRLGVLTPLKIGFDYH